MTNNHTLHVTNFYHPTSGGIRTFYGQLLASAPRLGRRITLVVPGDRDEVVQVNSGARIHVIRSPRSPIFDQRYRLILPHRFLGPWANRLRSILAAERPTLVEINDKYSLCYLAGLLRKSWWADVPRPVLVGHSSERLDDGVAAVVSSAPPGEAFAKWYMSRIYVPLFDYHVANSSYTASELTPALPPWRREHLTWLPMGVDIDRFGAAFRDERLRRRLLGDRHRVLVLYAGRLNREKGVGQLVDMMTVLASTHPGCRLVVAGDGPLRPWLETEAARRADADIVAVGHIADPGELAGLLASADVFVHPNAREPFGITPLEAMAAGTAVVVPRAGGVLSYANDQTAWLAHPSGAGLATAVRAALDHPDERRRRIAAARKTAADLAWEHVAAQWFDYYDVAYARGVNEWLARPRGRAASRESRDRQ